MSKSAANLASAREYMRRRRAAVTMARQAAKQNGVAYVEPTLEMVYHRDRGVCYLCGSHCAPLGHAASRIGNAHPMRPTMDHMVPVSAGGLHSMENIALACYSCNRQKSDKH